MPEVILPCPACGSIDCECLFAEDEMYSVDCVDCSMRGPAERNPDSAISAWNRLPRALRWTHEPPKVTGWYWVRQLGESFDIMQHYNQADIDSGFNNERQLKQWAGPIAPPVEG